MTAHRRASHRCTRGVLRSPGRPPAWQRKNRRRFWQAIALGYTSEDAARDAGVSSPLGPRWFRSAGGMPPTHLSASANLPSERYLTFREREDIAIELAKGAGIPAIARKLGRSPSTISRVVRRNAATRSGKLDYRASTAQWHADRAARRPRPSKLASNLALRGYVEERLAGRVNNAQGGCFNGPKVAWKKRRAVRGSLISAHIHGTHVPRGGAVHRIKKSYNLSELQLAYTDNRFSVEITTLSTGSLDPPK